MATARRRRSVFDFDIDFQQRRFGPRVGTLVGSPVIAIEYEHLGLKRALWRHDFERKDSEMWLLDDGSVLIRSASGRKLWDSFTVDDHE